MTNRTAGFAVLLSLLLLAAPAAMAAQGLPGGRLVGPDDRLLPLIGTEVDAEVSGLVATVTVRQLFENGYREPIEVTYAFPLPDRAAVDGFTMQIGTRTVRSELLAREEAEREYLGAVATGRTAALVTQARPNLFTQRVANILPNERILVELTYSEELRREDGATSFVFPVVAAPRFAASGGIPSGAADEFLFPDELPRHALDLSVRLDAGLPIEAIESPSHEIDVRHDGGALADVSIRSSDRLPVKDFVLEWKSTTAEPAAAISAHRIGRDGTFCLTIQPEETVTAATRVPREVIFVLDCSGSMGGMPIETAKRVATSLLQTLGPDDLFNVLKFSDEAEGFAARSIPADAGNVVRALSFVDRMEGAGGTQFLTGLQKALEAPEDPYRMRMVLFLSDGLIGNEPEVLAELAKRLGNARTFSLGVGSSVNRFFLDRLAVLGRGTAAFVRQDAPEERVDEVVDRFLARIRSPVLHDVTIDWGGLPVRQLEPWRYPDLFAGQPIRIFGRYDGGGRGTVTIRGLRGRARWQRSFDLALPEFERRNSSLPRLWARERIRRLMLEQYSGEVADVSAEVTALGLAHRLLTPYTAFVAVDERIVADGDATRRIRQKAAWPEGVGGDGFFGILVATPRGSGRRPAATAPAPKPYVPGATRPTFPENRELPILHLAWLKGWQREDGSWAGAGDLLTDTGATALALLALDACGTAAGEGPYGRAVERGFSWLSRHQDRRGCFAPPDAPNPVIDHALATIAWLDASARSGWRSGWSKSKRAVAWLVTHRTSELGWARDGGAEGSDTLATAFAVIALDRARRAGIDVDAQALLGATAHLEAVTERSTGLVSMGPGTAGAVDGHAIAAAILARATLGAQAMNTTHVKAGAKLLLDLPPPVGDRADPLYIFLKAAALKRVGSELLAAWDPPLNEGVRKGMIPREETDEDGAPVTVGPPGARLGRASALALFGMARCVFEPGWPPFPLR